MDQFAQLMVKHCAGHVDLPLSFATILERHYHLLCIWNHRLNLTSVFGAEELVLRHYCESLFLAKHAPSGARTVCDFGSGAGFPGLPLAVARPDCLVTLIESHKRKAVFLKEAARGIPNVRVLDTRGEQLTERFDVLVSRAVKWAAMRRAARRLAPVVLLLLSAEDGESLRSSGDFAEEELIPLPWGSRSVLFVGTNHPRST